MHFSIPEDPACRKTKRYGVTDARSEAHHTLGNICCCNMLLQHVAQCMMGCCGVANSWQHVAEIRTGLYSQQHVAGNFKGLIWLYYSYLGNAL